MSKPMSDDVLADYERGFAAEGELRGLDACQEIRRLRQMLEVVRGTLKKTIRGHKAAMREAVTQGLWLSFAPEDRCRKMMSTLNARLEDGE